MFEQRTAPSGKDTELAFIERARHLLHSNPSSGVFTRMASRGGAKKGQIAGHIQRDGYLRIQIDGRKYAAHRLAWLLFYGEWPAGDLDHVNLVKVDNRIENLRPATDSQNQANIFGRASAGLKGVTRHKSGWQAQIGHEGKTHYLGLFSTPEKAHVAYCHAAQKLFGAFSFTQHENEGINP